MQSRAGGGYEQILHWTGIVGARNAEQQKLIGQVQTAQAREAGLAQELSGAQQARQSLEVRMQTSSDAHVDQPLSFCATNKTSQSFSARTEASCYSIRLGQRGLRASATQDMAVWIAYHR